MYNFLSFLVVVSGADSFLLYLIWWIPTNHEFYASNRDWFQLFNQLLSFTSQTQEFLYIFMSTQKSTICFLVCSPSRQKKTVEKEIVVLFLFDKGQSENIFSSFLSSTSSGNWRLSTVVPLVWCVTTFDRYNRCTNARCILSSQAGTKHPQQLSNTCSGPDCSKGR